MDPPRRPPAPANTLQSGLDVREDQAAVVDFCLRELGQPPPSASFFRKLSAASPSAPSPSVQDIQARMGTQKELHRKEVSRLCDFQASQRQKLLGDQRAVLQGGDYFPDSTTFHGRGTSAQKNVRLNPLHPETWAASAAVRQQTHTFDDTLFWFNRSFIQSQQPLYREMGSLVAHQQQEEHRRNRSIPRSLAEFNSISSKGHQISIARFLENKASLPQDVIIDVWAIEALTKSYRSDPAFQARVQDLLGSISSIDPRQRPKPQQTIP